MTVVWCIERSNKNFPKSLFKTLYSLKFHFSWTRHVIWLLCFYCFYLLSSESISNDSFGCEDTEWCMCFSTENNTEQIICRWQTVSVVSAENGNWSEVRVLDSPVIPNTDKRNKSCHKFISYPWNKSLLQLTPSPSSSQSSRTIRVWCVCGGGGVKSDHGVLEAERQSGNSDSLTLEWKMGHSFICHTAFSYTKTYLSVQSFFILPTFDWVLKVYEKDKMSLSCVSTAVSVLHISLRDPGMLWNAWENY